MNITLAKSSGFCFGVKRAIDMALNLVEENKAHPESNNKIYTLGEIINNKQVVDKLEKIGVSYINNINNIINTDNINLIIRSHGVPISTIETLKEKNIRFLDATCPFVAKIHKIVSSAKDNDKILIYGNKNHPEIIGIIGHCNKKNRIFVFKDEDELKGLLEDKEIVESSLIVVSQTTSDNSEWKKLIDTIKKVCRNALIFD